MARIEKKHTDSYFEEKISHQIRDEHEDSIHTGEENILHEEHRSSYKVEIKALKKKLDSDLKTLSFEKNKKLEEMKDAKPEEIELVVRDFADKEQDLRTEFDKNDSLLKIKYEDELRYRISPRLKRATDNNPDVLLSVRHLKEYFRFGNVLHHNWFKAVSNVSFDIKKGECFGIVGESGCGKTTTGRTIIRLYKPTSGSVYYKGYRIGAGSRWNEKEIKWTAKRGRKKIKELKVELNKKLKELDQNSPTFVEDSNKLKSSYNEQILSIKSNYTEIRKVQRKKIKQIKYDQSHCPRKLMNEIQMIFQDPIDSLDPRMTVEDIIQEGLIIQGQRNKKENHKKVVEMLEKVGLVEEHASRYPHEFSGGQRQRIGIARALIMRPKLLICDEPISALDVSIRAQVINLLNKLKEEMGLTLIFIAHDLSVVKYFCDRIAVMYYGKIVEIASSEELFRHPLHPYTVSLLSAIPKPNPLTERERTRIIYNPATTHDYSTDKPTFREVAPGHQVYCNEREFNEYLEKIKELDSNRKLKK